MVTNKNKVTLGGSWLLLTLLMIGMSWSGAVSPVTEDLQTSENDGTEDVKDPLALPDEATNPADKEIFGYDPGAELIGSRTETAKTFLKDDGDFAVVVSTTPLHYMVDGAWEDIDLNLVSNENGWGVTENTYEAYFPTDGLSGVQMVVDGETIRYGIMPMVVVLDGNTLSEEPYMGHPSGDPIDVGANVIRYPLQTGLSLDYQVDSTQLKQNLVVREAPQLLDHQKESGYFGISETMVLPTGFALFLGESPIADGETVKTNQSLSIRNLETGAQLVSIPQPFVTSADPEANLLGPYIGLYVIHVEGTTVTMQTVVENTWLMDEDNRTFPILIDPTLDKSPNNGGYAYYYRYSPYNWGWYSYTYEYAYSNSYISYTCRGASSYYNGCTSSSYYPWFYYYAWYRFDFNNALPSGATVNDADFKSKVGRYYGGNRNFQVSVIKSGSSQSSNPIDPNSYLYSGGRNLNRYIRNSAASSASTTLSDPNYYWYGGSLRTISMNSNGVSDVQDAIDGNAAGSSGHVLGVSVRNTNNAPQWYWCSTGYNSYYGCRTSTTRPYMHITYTGGTDTDPPDDTFVPYTDITTHREESRTFWLGLIDITGVDTTSSGRPTLNYRVDNGTWTKVTATIIGTCLAGYYCNFKASIPAVQEGEYVQYFWAFQDTVGTAQGTTGNPNFKTLPLGGTGTPSNPTAPSSPYNYFAQPVEEADAFNSDGTKNNKWQLGISEVHSYLYYRAYKFYDQQLTYYEDTKEWIWEYDTSDCGTGSNQCFNTNNVYHMKYAPNVNGYSYSNCAQYTYCKKIQPGLVNTAAGGYTGSQILNMNGQHGPQMSTIWYYNTQMQEWGMIGLDTQTGIDKPVVGPTVGTQGGARNCDDCYSAVPIPGDITMKFGTMTINGTWNTGGKNWFCTNSNNHPLYFIRTSSSNPYCLYSYTTWQYDRMFNGWITPGYDGRWGTGAQLISKVSTVRPVPDTFPVIIDGDGLMDTHSEDARTVRVHLEDAGDPPSGVNISTGTDANGVLEGPSLQYRVFNASAGTWSAWTTRSMNPVGASRAACEFTGCDWQTTIPGTDRGNDVEYKFNIQDNLNNWNNTTAVSYNIGTPTKVFTVEWHDQTCGYNNQYMCSWQVKMYDVTNEVEYHFDTNSHAYYNYQSTGYQKGGSTPIGATLVERPLNGYINGNPFSNNFRIATDGTAHAAETMPAGMTELYNYNEELTGSSNGYPYHYYCTRYWSSYRYQCATVIDLPTDFDFDWFGTTYSANSSDTFHANRFGAAALSTSSSGTPMQQTYYYWGSSWPTMPSTAAYARNVHFAPWYGYYASYYCYDSGSSECSIRTKTVPFGGAGMDIYSDITQDTIWDKEMSPIRVVPSGDYIRVTADLTIEAGVEVQFASGKGIDMAGQCSKLVMNGNESSEPDGRITVTNIGGSTAANGKGFAFTRGGCSAGTTDRHQMENVDFSNLDIAISAGSRHGSSPHYNGNVGDFTFDDVTFTDVGTAIKHGSGQYTNFDLSGVSITNATNSCVDLPDYSDLTWNVGSMTNCNQGSSSSHGALMTGYGGDISLDEVSITNAAHNAIAGGAKNLWAHNVSIDTSGLTSSQLSGSAWGQTYTASGSSLYLENIGGGGYATGINTYAVDSLDIIGGFDGGSVSIIPRGPSSSAMGPSGYNLDDITSTGNVYLERTTPSTIYNLNADGYLKLASTASSSDQISAKWLTADGITIAGCGWSMRAEGVTLGGGSAGSWATASCTSNSARSELTVMDGTVTGNQNQGNIFYARNAKVTLADLTVTGQTTNNAYLARSSTNGEVRLIGVNWRGQDCADAGGWTGQSTCWVDVSVSSGKIYVGGTGQLAAYRMIQNTTTSVYEPVFFADHSVTSTTVSTSGTRNSSGACVSPCSVTDVITVGTTYTNSQGNASAWLIQDRIEKSGSGVAITASYSEHRFEIAGGAGQLEVGPGANYWNFTAYPGVTHSSCTVNSMDCSIPISPGDQRYFELEAAPIDWNGGTKDCAFVASESPANQAGYSQFTAMDMTLSANLVLDGCKVHLNGTSFKVNRTANNNPTITLKNGGELYVTSAAGLDGFIKPVTSIYGWVLNIDNGGNMHLGDGYLRGMYQNSAENGLLIVGSGGTLTIDNGGIVYGSQTVSATMATIKVNGGTMITDNATVLNHQQNGVGVWLEATGTSNVQNIHVSGAATGIVVKKAAPIIDGFTLDDNTVGMEINGGMSLPTVYRSPLLSGVQRGWETYDIDLSELASQHNYIQFGFNSVYEGGNVHPSYNYYTSRYYGIYDRMRIALDTGSGPTNFTVNNAGKQMTGYYESGDTQNLGDRNNPNHPSRNDGWARYDCNLYGYQYSPGGSYQYGYYYYFQYYGPYTSSGNYYGANSYPKDFGFTLDIVDGLTGSQNYYPYNYWGYYYRPQHAQWNSDFYPPEGFNGLWGNYNICLNYAYRYQTPTPNGYRVSWPIVDVSDSSVQGVNAYMDIMHNYNDYFGDRYEFVFRGGSDINDLMSADWGRTFGKADIKSGTIDNADTGIYLSGNDAAGVIDGVTINDPSREGVLISGRASVEMNGITVNDGRYGVRAENSASGRVDATNSVLDGQSQDGVVMGGGLKMNVGGTISNASNAGVNILSSSANKWQFDNLNLADNNIGILNGGTGWVRCDFCTTSGNTMDVETSSLTRWIEGDINLTRVQANPGGTLERGRLLDLTVNGPNGGLSGVGVLMVDGDGKKVSSEKTGSGGLVEDMVFYTAYVEPGSGVRMVNLSGYKVMSAAKISYSTTVADFRYANTGVTLVDAPGNSDTVALTDNFDAHICYSWTSTSYNVMQSCSGSHYMANTASRQKSNGNGGTIMEYGYYTAIPANMKDMAILVDTPFTYSSTNGVDMSGSTVIFSGFINQQYSQFMTVYPYSGTTKLDGTDAVAIGQDGKNTQFFTLGWSGSYDYGHYNINNSNLINIGTVGAGRGYYQRTPVMHITNSTFVSYSQQENVQSVYNYDVCISSAGTAAGNWIVDNNTFYDCTVAVMIWGGYYTTAYGGQGTVGARWSNNTVYDSVYLPFWSYLNSNAHDLVVDNNTITGTKRTGYGIYSQGQTTYEMIIKNNVIYTADEPIYMRNARHWEIEGNTIYGDANPSHSGIYVRNGEGVINGNTLIDSDGGINVYGVRSGYDVEIHDNTISASGGRVSPVATGIYIENCGLADVTMGGNHVTTTSNALVSDGCDIDDTGSSFNSAGGSASQIHTVEMEANQFNPAIKNISTGDTVRWVLTAYNSGVNYQHSTVSNDSLWDSGLLNLGGTFTYTFTSPGSYEYHCDSHTWMNGIIHVTNSTSTSNLATYGVSMVDGNEDVSFNGTSIGGFSLAYAQTGGDLDIKNMVVTGGTAFELENVDVTIDGLDIAASSTGYGIDARSSNGRHTLEIENMNIVGGLVGLKSNGHDDFRWNEGTSSALTSLQTVNGATGSIENVTWGAETLLQIDAGAYSTITSVGNMPGLNQSMMSIGTSAVVHQAQFLDLTVLHNGAAASDVGLLIKSTDNGRSEYVSPAWRSNVIAVGEGPGGVADYTDWFVSHPMGIHNIADDAMPGAVAVNPDPSSQAMGYMTWDNNDLYIMLSGVTFTVTDGMWYLDTQQGGSTVGDSWYVSHNLPFEADYMLWAEDLNNWGIRKVMPGGNWVDVTSACSGMRAAPGFGIPGVTATFSGLSEFSIPWSCIGSPTTTIKTLAIIQNENSGHVLGVYPPQYFDQTSGTSQTFQDFGTLNLVGDDLANGELDAFLLVHRTFTATGATAARNYDITVKVRDVDNIYWDWATEANVSMDQNQDITIDIMRAKPAIVDMDDLSVNEDTGSNVISLITKAQDYQDDSSALTWTVTNDVINPSNASSPFSYSLSGTSLTITPNPDEFGNHRLYVSVTDTDGLTTSQSVLVSVQNVNDAPEINNPQHPTGMPTFTQVLAADGSTVYNVYDEPQRRNPVTGEEMTWDLITINLGSSNGNGYVSDLANEQDSSLDNNTEQAPQSYTWTAATDPVDCSAFSVSVQSNTLVIDLAEDNEAGGTCDIVLDLSDGASVNDAAPSVSVPFTINPVNDQPEILDWNVSRGAYITTSYLDSNGDKASGKITDTTATHEPWYWQVNEDTTDEDLLTIDLSRMMSDNDHTIDQLSWEVDQTQSSMDQCNYHNYFEVNVDNVNQEITLDLIPDATTDADSSEWDMLQDADGDGTPDDGIHQMSPMSGTFCAVKLWMNDTASPPSQIDYAQSATGTYDQGSSSQTLYIRVHNQEEARPDFSFDDERISPQPVYFQGIDGVLRETLVPVSVSLQMDGDEPINPDGTYKYLYDLRVSFYTSEVVGGQGTYQGSVRLGSNGPGDGDMALPDWDGETEVLSYARLNKTSEDVRVFVDVMTVNPFTGQYTDNSKYEKPALEESNWANNNMSSSDTDSELPLIVEVRAAASVSSFAPTLMAVGLVGVFVGALLSRSRAIEDEEEFEESALVDDEGAVSPVIATILLVAITVVLAGVIYVWAGSLADTSTKGVPQLTFTAEAITVQEVSGLDQDQWHWRITTTYAATDLATQAIKISVLWNNASGQQVYTTSLAPTSGDIEHVYGFAPRNSPNMVTFWDDVSACEKGGAPCITEFGAGDRIFVRMTDNDGLIDSAQIDIKYELPGGAAYVLKQYTASATSIR